MVRIDLWVTLEHALPDTVSELGQCEDDCAGVLNSPVAILNLDSVMKSSVKQRILWVPLQRHEDMISLDLDVKVSALGPVWDINLDRNLVHFLVPLEFVGGSSIFRGDCDLLVSLLLDWIIGRWCLLSDLLNHSFLWSCQDWKVLLWSFRGSLFTLNLLLSWSSFFNLFYLWWVGFLFSLSLSLSFLMSLFHLLLLSLDLRWNLVRICLGWPVLWHITWVISVVDFSPFHVSLEQKLLTPSRRESDSVTLLGKDEEVRASF